MRRSFLVLLSLVCCVLAGELLPQSFRTLTLPAFGAASDVHLVSQPDPRNGMRLALGLFAALLALLSCNAAWARQDRLGPVDWLLSLPARFLRSPFSVRLEKLLSLKPSNPEPGCLLTFLPALGLIVLPFWLLGALVVHTTSIQMSGLATEAAAQGFKNRVKESAISQTGGMLFALGADHRSHVAPLTPALIRALDREGVRIGSPETRPVEYPLPGILPVLLLFTCAVAAGFPRAIFTGFSPGRWWTPPRVAGVFGLVNLYMVWWLTSGQMGIFYEREINPEWLFYSLLLGAAGLSSIAAISRILQSSILPFGVRDGWRSLFFSSNLAAIVSSYVTAFKSPGTPVLLWLLAYLIPSLMCWAISVQE